MHLPKYTITKLGLQTNGEQLRINREQILKQAYQYQAKHQKYIKKNDLLKSYNPTQNKHQNYEINDISEPISTPFPYQNKLENQPYNHSNTNIQSQIIKNSLFNELSQQIKQKSQTKKQLRYRQIQNESNLIRYNKSLENHQQDRQKTFYRNYQQQALENIRLNEQKKIKQKQNKLKEKEYYNWKYKESSRIVEDILKGNTQNLNKNNKMKQKTLNNPELYPIQQSILHQRNLHQQILKQTLLSQIKQGEELKKIRRQEQLYNPYIMQSMKYVDHPILNPIDLKVAKDNPYLMRELVNYNQKRPTNLSLDGMDSTQNHLNKNMNQKSGSTINLIQMQTYQNQAVPNSASFLSRRGSSSLLGNYY